MRSLPSTHWGRKGQELAIFQRRQKIIDLQKRGTLGIKIFLFLINEDVEPNMGEMLKVFTGLARLQFDKHTHATDYPGLRGPKPMFPQLRRDLIGAKA